MKSRGLIEPINSQLGFFQRIIDAVTIISVLIICVWGYHQKIFWTDKYTIAAISAVIFFYLSANLNNVYRSYRIQGILGGLSPLVLAWFNTVIGLLFLGYISKSTHELSRVTLGVWMGVTPLFLYYWRTILRKVLYKLRGQGYNSRSVVIVGIDDNAIKLARNFIQMKWMGLNLKGFITNDASGKVLEEDGETISVIGGHQDLFEMAKSNKIDAVYIAVSAYDRETMGAILKQLGNSTVSIFIVPDYYAAEIMQGTWVTIGGVPTVSVINAPTQGISSSIKRLEDIIVSIFAIITFTLPMLLIALSIKLSSPGSVLFKQKRYGINGDCIEVWKFRSMLETRPDHNFKQTVKHDARVTPIGRLLRRTSLDELPQFFNVLFGSMSIVGPRPHAVEHNEQIRGRVNGYMLRHIVKPGMTGLAQINGYRGEMDTDEKIEQRVRYDIEYICNWSIWLDVIIILKTPIILCSGKNAY